MYPEWFLSGGLIGGKHCIFCHPPREDLHHWVIPPLGLIFAPIEHVAAVCQEDAAEEGVDGVHLSDDVDEVENVADKVLERVEVPQVESLPHVLDQLLALVLSVVQ